MADDGKGGWMFALAHLIPLGDKAGHFLLFGTLSFLANLLSRAAKINLFGITAMKGSAIVLSIVTLEECSQLFFKSRTFDLLDLTADVLGIWFFSNLAARYLRWKSAKLKALTYDK
ncbi:MAG TPA: VanZ family protein [Candidatus Baltobacteraceae bacterium]|nr:VanZ family protein [Candidatus Baltobacteraceae bacterium]